MLPIVRYDGGKGGAGVAQWIINQIPPHNVYIEPFLGGGAVMRAKRPAACSIGVERDTRAVSLWAGESVPGLSVICGDGISWLRDRTWAGGEFVYCDPPYLRSVRSDPRRLYRCEIQDDDHVRLLSILVRLPVPVAISGYWSVRYASLLSAWRTSTFRTVKRNGKAAEEWLWMNYPEPVELHDYRFLGDGFRERERIKRKCDRWRRRLAGMDVLERRALLAALSVDRASSVSARGSGSAGALGESGDAESGLSPV